MKIDRKLIDEVTKKLVDDGKIVEAGWVGLRMMAIPTNAPQVQIDEMRNAFFAGAQHLFSSIMSVLDPGDDATDNDLRRMDIIDQELRAFAEEFTLRHVRTEGDG